MERAKVRARERDKVRAREKTKVRAWKRVKVRAMLGLVPRSWFHGNLHQCRVVDICSQHRSFLISYLLSLICKRVSLVCMFYLTECWAMCGRIFGFAYINHTRVGHPFFSK